jgi:hypothetical protein
VQAAGNLARRHWSGTFSDTDADNYLDFSRSQKYINVTLATGTFEAYLSWYATAGPTTSRDYDLVLADSAGAIVAQSGYAQNGDDAPSEKLAANIATAGTYRLQVLKVSGAVFADAFQLFTPAVDIAPTTLQVADGSLGIPAEASGAFAVGATRGTTVDTAAYGLPTTSRDVIEPFSSHGSSTAAAIKPNLVAPDACRTSLAAVGATPIAAGGDFIAPNAFGTSFAAAHVAGAAALIWSEDNTRTNRDLTHALVLMAKKDVPPPVTGQPAPPAVPNTIYGNGRLQLRVGIDLAKPTIVISYPASGDTITSTMPTITAYLSDSGGSGIDIASIALELDGVRVDSGAYTYDDATGKLTYAVPATSPLGRGSHQITLNCSDLVGNDADEATSSFRVSLLTIASGLHMISLPYDFSLLSALQMRPSAVFGLPTDQVVVARWLPTDTTPTSKYHYFGGDTGVEDQYASFVPLDTEEEPYVVASPPAGLGYFINADSTATINTGNAAPLTGVLEYRIQLSFGSSWPRGWNMIGCPFQDAVSWSTVEFVTDGVRQDLVSAMASGITEGIIFELKTSGGVPYYDFAANPLGAAIQPWKGYWVHVLKNTTLVLYNSVGASAAKPATLANATPSTDNWSLRFGAAVSGGLDPTNYVGVSCAASTGGDSLDVPEPPAVSSGVSVFMPRNSWGQRAGNYARDIRPPVVGSEQWDVVVTCAQPAADVTVSWPDLNATVPAGVALVLKDLDAGRVIYMRTTAGYTYRSASAGEERHLAIVATAGADGQLLLSGVTTTRAGARRVIISYSVNQAADVEAEIVNVAGRSIRKLGATAVTPGQAQSLNWDCRSTQGSAVPAGRYLLRLTARTQSGQAVQSVRAFQLGR